MRLIMSAQPTPPKLAAVLALILALTVALFGTLATPTVWAAPLYESVPVSDIGTGNSLAEPNSSRMVAVSSDGTIYVAYRGTDGVRVARSTNRGQSFEPSIQLTPTNAQVSIAVDANGVVYVAYATGGQIYLSRSTDGGQTFSSPTSIAAINTSSVDIAVDAPYVYVLPSNGLTLLVNDAAGVGTFASRTTGLSSRVYSGILVDPATHELFVIGDNPAMAYVKSTDRGATFGSVVSVSGSVFFSTYIGGFGFIGQKVYVAGWQTSALLVDLAAGTSSARTFGNNTNTQSRTLAVDGEGNVVDGYSTGGNVLFAVSTDQGQTFGTPQTVAVGSSRMELALNPTTNDIVAAYEKGGQIFLNVYAGQIPTPPVPPTISDITDQMTAVNEAVGPIAITVSDSDGDPATVTLGGSSSNQSLVPNANISFGGNGTSRTVTVTPATGISGNATITIVATDTQGRSATDTFLLTVKASQTINFPAPADTTYGAAPVALSATATSGLTITFSSQTPGVCTVSGSTATLVAAGTCTIVANQAGDDVFMPATQVQASFNVAQAPLEVKADDQARPLGEANPPLTFTATGFVNNETPAVLSGTLSTSATVASLAGTYAITQGTLTAANYAINFTPGTLTVIAPRLDQPRLFNALTSADIALSWEVLSDTRRTGLRLERTVEPTGSFILLATLPPTQTSYLDTEVVTGNVYRYRLTALGSSQARDSLSVETRANSPQSGTQFTATRSAPLTIPAASWNSSSSEGSHLWQVVTLTGALSTPLQVLPDRGLVRENTLVTRGPALSFAVDFSEVGTYTVWARLYGPSHTSDSIHVGLNGAVQPTSDRLTAVRSQSWHWTNRTIDGPIATIAVTQTGVQTLTVWMREDGTALDQLLLVPDGVITSSVTPAEENGGLITIDAARPSRLVNRFGWGWFPATQSGSSGVGALQALPDIGGRYDSNFAQLPVLDYPVNFTQVGTYTIWARLFGPNTAGDSLHIGLNGVPLANADGLTARRQGAWHWSNRTIDGPIATIAVTQTGVQTLTVWMREDGTALDELLLLAQRDTSVTPAPPAQAQGGLLVLEAETPQAQVQNNEWRWTATITPSGAVGSAMAARPDVGGLVTSPPMVGPQLSYAISLNQTTSYTVWVRMWAADATSDSVYVGVGNNWVGVGKSAYGRWHWTKAVVSGQQGLVLSEGVQKLTLAMREDGVLIDRILLTSNPNFVPTGNGPAASPR